MSEAQDFTGIAIGLYEPSPGLFSSLDVTLVGALSVRPVDLRSLEAVCDALAADRLDALVLDAGGREVAVRALVRDLREGRIGPDPFLPVLVLHESPAGDPAQAIRLAGADAVLDARDEPEAVADRLAALRAARRRFVVCGPYPVPEHRRIERPGQASEMVEVPNRLAGPVDATALDEAKAIWARLLDLGTPVGV